MNDRIKNLLTGLRKGIDNDKELKTKMLADTTKYIKGANKETNPLKRAVMMTTINYLNFDFDNELLNIETADVLDFGGLE